MRNLKKFIFIGFLGIVLSSCTENFAELNTDTKNPTSVAGEALFTNAQKALVDQTMSTNVNRNVFKLWAQYWTETTYTDEANYDIVNRTIADRAFETYYLGILKDFAEAKKVIEATNPSTELGKGEKANKLAIINLLEVFAYQDLVDHFGNVPYSEALAEGNISPKYDDASAIYADLVVRVNKSIADLKVTHGSFGASDLMYGGNTAKWLKFAHSLKLKLGIHLADVAGSGAQAIVEAAAAGAFTSNADDALLVYATSSPNTNPIYEDLVLSGRSDFVAANTIVDLMNGLNDPRRAGYFTMVDTSTTTGVVKMAYKGGLYGHSSPYATNSHPGDVFYTPDFAGILLTYSEVEFYLAEAAARGWNVGGTPESHYNEGIKASFAFWGFDATAYLAQANVAYSTATGDWKQKIATQSWLASYGRGFLGYTTWRRLDWPAMNIAPTIKTVADIPTRFTYPINEQTLNAANYAAAATAIGTDKLTTKLFWDKN